ncbi:MAG: magnesium transporter CorA family protein [Dehalococcoidia bacterium]|nr:magnesium transporter CorA family protein [Dehalococcoidia bacterium]
MPHIAIHRDEAGTQRRLASDRAILDAHREARGLLWVHITEMDAEDEALLHRLRFHPLAIEDAVSRQYRRPKVENFGDYLFIVLHGIDDAGAVEEITTTELDLFVGPTFVVSSSMTSLAWSEHLIEQPAHAMARGTGMLAYTIIDALVDSVLPVVERMDEVAETIEERALAHPSPDLLEHILRLKRAGAMVGRVMTPQRDLLARIARGDYAPLDGENGAYFRDVTDHLERIEDLSQALRDRADHLVVLYHSALGLRQNEAMRQLAIVASIFMPLTLLTGIYGMNFQHMPELGWQYGHFAVLGIIAVTVSVGTFWLWGRAFLGRGQRGLRVIASYALEPHEIRDAVRRSAEGRERVLDTSHREADDPAERPR